MLGCADATWSPSSTRTPTAVSRSAIDADASGSSRGMSQALRWMTVTRVPSTANRYASSQPTGPPPITAIDSGCSLVLIACSLVHAGTASRPGTSGRSGVEPILRTRSRYPTRVPSTSTTPGCTTAPVPRNSLAPVFCYAAAVKLSSRPWTIRSLRATAC
jgi:hypothetical protein